MIGSRFAIGFRIILPADCGAVGMPAFRFSVLNFVGAAIWVVPVAWVGYYFGHGVQASSGEAHRYELWFVSAFAAAALAIVLVRHKRQTAWTSDLSLSDIHRVVPYAVAFMGVVNVASAIWPRSRGALEIVRSWLPLEAIQQSRSLMLFAGIALLQITRGLMRRQKAAWAAATIAVTVTLVLHITRAFDLHHSLVAAFLLAYLVVFRHRFSQHAERAAARRVLINLLLLVSVTTLYGYLGLSHLRGQFAWRGDANPLRETLNSAILIRQPAIHAQTELASSFLSSFQVAGWMARLYLLAVLLKPAIAFGFRTQFRKGLQPQHKAGPWNIQNGRQPSRRGSNSHRVTVKLTKAVICID
jgi:hypothetical protein